MPVIGGLFSNRSKSLTSTEIVVLITPRIVNYAATEPEADAIRRVEVVEGIIEDELGEAKKKVKKVMGMERDIHGRNVHRHIPVEVEQ